MSKVTKIILTSESDKLRFKVLEIKSQVPSGISYMPYYEQLFGKQSDEQTKRIRNVWNLRNTDIGIIENFSKMVKQIQIAYSQK